VLELEVLDSDPEEPDLVLEVQVLEPEVLEL